QTHEDDDYYTFLVKKTHDSLYHNITSTKMFNMMAANNMNMQHFSAHLSAGQQAFKAAIIREASVSGGHDFTVGNAGLLPERPRDNSTKPLTGWISRNVPEVRVQGGRIELSPYFLQRGDVVKIQNHQNLNQGDGPIFGEVRKTGLGLGGDVEVLQDDGVLRNYHSVLLKKEARPPLRFKIGTTVQVKIPDTNEEWATGKVTSSRRFRGDDDRMHSYSVRLERSFRKQDAPSHHGRRGAEPTYVTGVEVYRDDDTEIVKHVVLETGSVIRFASQELAEIISVTKQNWGTHMNILFDIQFDNGRYL
ncbi:unnamed protein product, partial [Amoebophrya sp. A25]